MGAGLSQDGPRPPGGGVVGETGLHRGQCVRAGLVPPAPEVPGPPLDQVGVGDVLQHLREEIVVGKYAQTVQDSVLLVRLHPRIRLVQALYGLLEDRLHPGTPLLPQTPAHPHDGVGGAVAVGEDAGVQQVDAGSAAPVGQVDEPDPVGERFRNMLQQSAHQVGVRVDHHDRVTVPARRLLAHLVGDDVVHEGGLAHAGAGHVEMMAPEQIAGEVDLPRRCGHRVPDVGSSPHPPGRRQQHLRPCAGHKGRLVTRSRRVPQGRHLTDTQDAAGAEQPGARRMQRCGGQYGPYPAHPPPRSGRVVVVGGTPQPPAPGALWPAGVRCPAAG